MIDTIKLTLDKSMFWIKDNSKFERNTMNSLRGYYTMVQNPTKGELINGIYKPRLTLSHRYNCSGRSEETLAIELSLPKLLFGNNFDELVIDDYQKVVEKLNQVLKQMGVYIFLNVLERAPISLVHYSKNIPLTDGSIPHYMISKIKEANVSLSLDINQTDYRNDGHSYKWHSSSYEVTFYDKIKDLEIAKKSEKRAIEKDNKLQLGLFDEFQKRKIFEVLRMEIRLNQRQKIKQLFKTLGVETEITFKNLFDPIISQKILLYYLNEINKNRIQILDYKNTRLKDFISTLVLNNSNLSSIKILQIIGLKTAIENFNIREFKQMISKGKDGNWYRFIKQVKELKLPTIKNPLTVLEENLIKFEPLHLIDYQPKMLNNDKYN